MKPLRLLIPITLATLFFIVAPANRVATVPLPATSPASSPTPAPTRESDEEQPNALRRFFSWVKDGITRPFRKRRPKRPDLDYHYIYILLKSSSSLVTFCPQTGMTNNCASNQEVKLVANTNVPEGQGLWFTWMVTAGRLRGDGREVIWDLTGVPEGTYTATVEVHDNYQHAALETTKVTVSLFGNCDAPPPPCPRVTVSCPSEVGSQREIIFVANVMAGEPDLKPTYNWSASAGKIVSGQGTSKITIDTSDMPRGQAVTASVCVGGLHPACAGNASCTIPRH